MTCPGQSERGQVIDIAGAPEEIRTHDPQIRRLDDLPRNNVAVA
jgi:hypothetical protein